MTETVWTNVRRRLLDVNTVIWVYVLLTLAATIQKLSLGTVTHNGLPYPNLPNFAIYRSSFFHLLSGRDLYLAAPAEQWDLFKYSPTFALLIAPFALLPYAAAAALWNLLNAIALGIAIKTIPIVRMAEKGAILWFVLPAMLGSVQNAQSNALMAGLVVAGFSFKHRGRESLAAFCLVLSIYIKLFGAVALLLWLLYPRKWRFAGWCALWAGMLFALPLCVVPFARLIGQYSSWFRLLQIDRQGYSSYSAMGWLQNWFGLNLPTSAVLTVAAVILLAPLARREAYHIECFGLFLTASILVWVVIFNHVAESPTYVIAMTGIAMWYFAQVRRTENLVLLLGALVFCSFSSTDVFPRYLRDQVFKPYSIKVIPCLVAWLKMSYDLWSLNVEGRLRAAGQKTAVCTGQVTAGKE